MIFVAAVQMPFTKFKILHDDYYFKFFLCRPKLNANAQGAPQKRMQPTLCQWHFLGGR